MTSRSHGFTLIELLVVMLVLGILASAAFPLAELSLQRQRESELRRNLWEIRDAIDAYKRASDAGNIALAAGESGYPPSLQALVDETPNPKDSGKAQYFLRRIPRDPFADENLPAVQTWGLRSYVSSHGNPKPGSDVYDVFSLSGRTAINGVALREW